MDAGAMDAAADAGPDADHCEALGLPRAALRAGTGSGFDDVAGDFTVETLNGTWTLEERFSGCDSYVFLNFAATDYGQALFETRADELYLNGPRNVHYFFTSYDERESAIRARMEALADEFEVGFDAFELSEEERAFWRSRLHFVIEPLVEVEGSVGELVREQSIIHHTFAIMRDQRFDPLGSLYEFGAFGAEPDLGMAAYAGPYYNYLAALSARLASEDVTVISLADETDVTARLLERDAVLPDAAAMAAFDTMELDVEVHCRQDPANCSEWDRNAYIHLCVDEACSEMLELGRWITPYSRPGRMRWVWDASPLLGLLQDGGARRFRITTGPDWEEPTRYDLNVSLRLSSRGEAHAAAAELAFTGGPFDASYNDGRAPFTFTPPAGTSKVELLLIVSGHGQSAPYNCAEWCNHEHTFTLNESATYRVDFPDEAGEPLGCANRAAEGVVPGQWGNWAPGRAGWCPGLPVEAQRFDITDGVKAGAPNELTYAGSFKGGEPPGGENVVIDLSAYVVYYD